MLGGCAPDKPAAYAVLHAVKCAPLICCVPDECVVGARSNHRGLRHYWGLRIKGQHTKTTGRRGKTVGVAKKR